MSAVRVRSVNAAPIRGDGRYVLYWMIAYRRTADNFALDRAVDHARELGLPLVVLEAIRVGHQWASERIHRFVLDGMADNADRFAASPTLYYPYVEAAPGAGSGLLETLAADAAVVVTDDHPGFFLPRMVAAAAQRVPVLMEAVDSNGLLPLAATDRVFRRAFDFRRFLQRELAPHLDIMPRADPFAGAPLAPAPELSPDIEQRWPRAAPATLRGFDLARLPIDHRVAPVEIRGGAVAAEAAFDAFVAQRLDRYHEDGRHPDLEANSRLSPWLHFGHISPHRIFATIAAREGFRSSVLGAHAGGQREGWWNMGAGPEAFLEQLVTWREIGFNLASRRRDYDRYDQIPDWAKRTLDTHANDPREHVYTLDQLAAAETDDEIWNAAQRQLVEQGTIHNSLRMLWGKRVIAWTYHPRDAARYLVDLNDRYAIDGRDPNSYSGIFWCFGRYDRAWGPERPIYGTVRYMTSASTRRKLKMAEYLRRWGRR